ncbi:MULTISPECIES: hotdog fold domain-containing protein [Sorangium]|uniref:Hotdog fold domain-containing protein n=1 Tax=Sorangium atrum TaxID=2995308 RepID=A0ABT5C9D3_9BACT|nr:hotdog fold domain-containing protein [Sorangium aterium]MDC0681772.1 hotdog fold domain-containing protein [Sorangium aterium]
MSQLNFIARSLAPLQALPSFLRTRAQSVLFQRMVPFTGTAGVQFDEVSSDRVALRLANGGRVRNHIGGVHAAAAGLLAETATGFVVAVNLPEDKLPLLRSMKIDYTRRARGGLRAVATLTPEQRQSFLDQPKGDVTVAVTVTDESGASPMECEFVWAWVTKGV